MPTIRARWNGPRPKVGEYLCSQHRPRGAYRIVHIQERGNDVLKLLVDRVKLSEVSVDAVVHPWRWDPRTKVGAAWSAQ